MKYTLVVLFVFLLSVLSAPIPERPEGYLYKPSPNKTVELEVYEDLLCSDCKAFDPPFKTFLKNYTIDGKPVTDFVEVKLHIFPLPYHHNAFFAARLPPYVYNVTHCGGAVHSVSSWVLKNQDLWLSAAQNLTEFEVLDSMCTEFSNEFGKYNFTKGDCLSAMGNRGYELDARTSWKYAAYNGVNGTPTVVVNGIAVDQDFDTVDDWVKFLEPFLKGKKIIQLASE